MKLKKYLEEAEVIKFKSKRVDDLEKVTDFGEFIKRTWPVSYKGLKKSKLKLFGKKK
jgi:hypothetical protein